MIRGFAAVAFLATSFCIYQLAAPAGSGTADDKPYGIAKRVPWTTSRVSGSPEPPPPYRTANAFPKLKFNEPLDMQAAPAGNRLYVVERYGKILSFPNQPDIQQPDLFLDLGKVLYGFACHPNFENNGFCYVTYITEKDKELPLGTRVSRFQATGPDRLKCDPSTEQVIIEWPSGGHNGGCLQFGPDGYLYIATGDSSGIADEYLTGQDMSVLPGKILRIDVNRHDAGKTYAIPDDNPFRAFAGVEGMRPEIWAYGLRQPWKMSFDRKTGELWTANVGQDLWEQVYRIERGGNYGWSVMEGSHPFRPERPRGPSPILMPVVEHSHADFRSITGGFVYHGSRLPDLIGSYIYGDYDTGRIWMLRTNAGKVTEHRELVDSSLRIVGFGQDAAGELFLVDHMGGGIHKLVANDATNSAASFPRKLSETGLFRSVPDHQPAPGLIPYSINARAWNDGAHKQWFLALPGNSQIEFEAIEFPQPAPGAHLGWKFPSDAVLVETISLDTAQASGSRRQRIETRILHNERLSGTEEVGDQYWRGYTYVWNDDQTDAVLLEDPQGKDRTFTIRDPKAPGGSRQIAWHYPSRAECTVCHNMAAKYLIGVTTMQMNRDHDYGAVTDNQLRTLEHIGLFTKPLPDRPNELPKLADHQDATASTGDRARSYLHANCSYCHRKWGGGNAEFQLLASLDLGDTKTVGAKPGQGAFFIPNAQVIAPGDPYRSVLFYRMAKLGPGRMPRSGSTEVDPHGVRLIHDWIAQLPSDPDQSADAASNLEKIIALFSNPRATGQARIEAADKLLASTPAALQLVHWIDSASLPEPAKQELIQKGAAHAEPHIRDLFERFLPESQRVKRLGTVINRAELLARRGDKERGKKTFFETAGVACRTCHRIAGQGGEVGPDLSEIGKKLDRAKLLDSMLDPSREVEPKYQTYLVATKSGQIVTGVLVDRSDQSIALRDAQNRLIKIERGDIDQLAAQQQSIMPELLLRDMSAEQVADLIEYLSSLR